MSLHKRNNAALTFIFITMVIDCIGFGIIIPVLPKLVQNMTGSDLSKASIYGGLLIGTYAAMQFLFSPTIGNLSDRFGRRPVLLFSLLGLGVDYLFMAFAPNIAWLFVGRLISGIFGASFTTASAYIADISPIEKRAQNFGMIGVAFGIGFMIGPSIGGFVSKFDHGTRLPFIVAACLSLLNFLYGFFILPESLSKEKRRKFEWKRANPAGAVMHIRHYPSIIGLLMALACLVIASHATQSTWAYFTMEKFHWTPEIVGYSMSLVGLLVGLVQGGLIRIAIPKLGHKNAVFTGFTMYLTGFLLFAFATQSWMMFAFLIPYCLGGLTFPSIQSIISAQVADNVQGEVQGIITSLMSLGAILGPLLMTFLFRYFTSGEHGYFPGAPFLAGAVLTAVSILIALKSLTKWHAPSKG